MRTCLINRIGGVFLLLICLLAFFQCSKDEVIVQENHSKILDIYPQVLPFSNLQDTALVNITASGNSWTATVSDTVKWLSVVQDGNLLSVYIQANAGEKRYTEIKIEAGEGDSYLAKGLLVIQDPAIVEESTVIKVPDFSDSYLYTIRVKGEKIGEICKEFLKSGETEEQAVVIYPMKNGKIDLSDGYVLNGGKVSWEEDGSCIYTPGPEKNVSTVYILKDGSYSSQGTSNTVQAELVPEVLTDQRGNETNVYGITKVADTYWITRNLNATKFMDGSDIPTNINQSDWSMLSTPGCAVYECDDANDMNHPNYRFREIMGVLYNAYAVQHPLLAPKGWRVATKEDWNRIVEYLGGAGIAGAHIKETGTDTWGHGSWDGEEDNLVNTGATNYSGLSCRPGGYRHFLARNNYHSIGWYCYFFANTPVDGKLAIVYCGFDSTGFGFGAEPLEEGCPVRLVRE